MDQKLAHACVGYKSFLDLSADGMLVWLVRDV